MRDEVRQILGCLMICFPSYIQDLKKNSFRRAISDELRAYYIGCVKSAMALMQANAGLKAFLDGLMRFVQGISRPTDVGLLDIFYRLLSFEPFRGYLQANVKENVLKNRAARNLSELSRLIKKFCFLHNMHSLNPDNKNAMPEELFNIYLKFLYIDGIGEYEDEAEAAPGGCVSFMTIHQSKGLEFPVVVVGSLGNVPRRSRDTLMFAAESRFFHRPPFEPLADIRYFDFWRLYYVAFSRAQNLLILAMKKEAGKYFSAFTERLPGLEKLKTGRAFARVRPARFKHIYSFTSHLSVYEGCPTQYKYYKEYAFAQNQMLHTSVGSLVHATLEDMNKCVIEGQPEFVTEEKIRQWFVLNYHSMTEQTGYDLTEEQQENALQQVIRYYRHRKDELGRVWKAEEEINLVLPEYILQGVIDLVEGEGDTVEIVDYKTGPKPEIADHPERVEHYRKQLEIYAYLIEKRYGKKVRRMHLYYTSTLTGDPIISFDWSREAVDRTVAEISRIVRKIENKDFEQGAQNTYACRFCDLRFVCGKAPVTLGGLLQN